jgi:hypothetical protein
MMPLTVRRLTSDGPLADQVWRTEFTTEQRNRLLRPPLAALPPHFAAAHSYHIGVHPNAPPLRLLCQLRAAVDRHPDGAMAVLIRAQRSADRPTVSESGFMFVDMSMCRSAAVRS